MDLNNHGQTHSNPVLNYGATLAHFMSVPSSRLPPMAVNSSLPQVKSEKISSNASSNTKPVVQSNQSSTTQTANGLLLSPSPKEESSTPTPGQGSGIPTLAAYSLPAHSVYELAALTQDLDTQGMTTKIKEVLLANNIGQKIFGEAVLGLSQGSVSELLSKPKPWHMLSIKGREPFIRMQLWLSDPRNIEHIQRLKTERREAGKRRRDLGFPSAGDAAPNSNASSNTNSLLGDNASSNEEGSVGGSPSPCGQNQSGPGASLSSSPSPAKKQRILFSEQQKEALKLAFSLDPYPSTSAMEFLAQELNLSTRTITNWFHNHRMRLKQQQSNDCSKDEISSVNGTSGSNGQPRESTGQFDPIHFRLLFHQRLFEMQANEEGSQQQPTANLAGNLNMMASLGMPYPFYATGMLSQFCMGLGGNNPSPDMASSLHTEGLDLTLGRQRLIAQSESDAEDSESESDISDAAMEVSSESRLKHNASPLVRNKSTPMSSFSPASQTAQTPQTPQQRAPSSQRRSRKPAAPQWVNPHWQQSPARQQNDEGRDATDKASAADRSPQHTDVAVDAKTNDENEANASASSPSSSSSSTSSDEDKMDEEESAKDDNEQC